MPLVTFCGMPTTEQQTAQLDRLASLEPGPFPVLSLYLNLQANERGRDQFDPFLRKELADRLRTYPGHGPERESIEQDAEKIRAYVAQLDPSLNGLALFASSGAGLFEAIPLAAPIEAHRLYIGDLPHLYPLARVLEAYPRYLALVADTHSARIFVFAANTTVKTERIENEKTKHHKQGGWSQARYQRHTENFHLLHAKEVVDAVDRIVLEEGLDKILISGDEVIVPLLRDQMPKHLLERILDVVKLDIRTPEHEVLAATMEVLRQHDADTDRERVDRLLDAYRGNGLGTVGAENVRRAFELGQVDELIITASVDASDADQEFIRQAHNTSAGVRFIEDAALLQPVGGVGAFLRFKL
jgi:peptide chain release factor subunit 1